MHTEADAGAVHDQLIDRDNPWPGLSAFTEENALFFHGRDIEAHELFRLIKRETLTVLFGLSGLGKTSLLQAGIFPFLRREDFLPVYVRLSYVEGAPDLVTQVKESLRDVSAKVNISSPPIRPGETLWAYFHRSENDFKTEDGTIVRPVLIFDQFEEMFTLGSNSDECQRRIMELLTELGDLIENRPPEAVEKQLEEEPEDAFSFYKSDYKVVFTLREDFLANLESLANQLPSIINNRFRLQKMNGAQALEVVLKAGGALVDQAVAEKIVKMVAGRDAYANIPLNSLEIEPTLLSVFCRELNNNRIARGDSKITAQLLTGSKEVILTGFYDRALKGFDERLRFFIEDKLLTGSGFRNSVDLQDALAMPGVSREAISNLIDRRLLRIEDSARMPRVELTHDVLTEVIKKSRDDRKAKETALNAEARARQANEEIRAKDLELRAAKSRNRGLQLLCLLAIICMGVSFWQWREAYAAKQRALAAEKRADANFNKIRFSNDAADDLIAFALSDLHKHLSGLGRVPLLDATAAKAEPLLNQQTADEGGMSDTQVHFQELVYSTLGDVSKSESNIDAALKYYKASIASAQKLVDRNPGNVEYLKDLAEKLSGLSNTLDGGSEADALVYEANYVEASTCYEQSLKLTRQLADHATSPEDKAWVDRQMANIYGRQGDVLRSTGKADVALKTLYQQSFDLRQKLVDEDPTNEAYQLDLANAYSRLGTAQSALGKLDESLPPYIHALDIRSKFAQRHKDDVNWQRSLFYSDLTLGRLLLIKGRFAGQGGALDRLTTGVNSEGDLAIQNPSNKDLQRELAIGNLFLGNYYRAQGDWNKAGGYFQAGLSKISDNQDERNIMWMNFFGVSYLDVGDALAREGKPLDAADKYGAALKIFLKLVDKNKASSDWQHNLAMTYERLGYLANLQKDTKGAEENYGNAIKTYNTTLQLNQKDPVTYNGRAWVLATCPLADLRNGPQAVQDATMACKLTNGEVWEDIDTLAAADAEAGNFKQAVADQKTALKVIDPSDTNEIKDMKSRLALYGEKQPYHLSPLASSDR
jgi:tetratricopeptide (TPR) repeat protein